MHISYQKTNVKTIDEKILITLFSIQEKYNKPYCYPAQTKLLELLKKYYGISICRRTLNYHLRYLEDNNFLSRKRRIKRLSDGTLSLSTSLYFITKQAYTYLKGVCRFVVSVLKSRPTWTKQFQLKDKIKIIEREPDPTLRRSKYLETIHDTLS